MKGNTTFPTNLHKSSFSTRGSARAEHARQKSSARFATGAAAVPSSLVTSVPHTVKCSSPC
eukprot:3051922-Heterocapsa_arctica.AAC.1